MNKELKIVADYSENTKLVRQKTAKLLGKTGVYIFLSIMALIVIIPFYWMLNISFQSTGEVLNSLTINFFP
ncbi:hypothetical protein KHQ89_01245 [Mycoplasmatota bacterium]|nr:hypothetical protein KHQ89_01245 [Mycoplasmatota bacterium]